jgi:hypothetical protein
VEAALLMKTLTQQTKTGLAIKPALRFNWRAY